MALIFAEGFDHYGTVQYSPTPGPGYGDEYTDSQSRYNMLSGVWAEVPTSAKVRYAGDDVGGYPFTPRTGRGSLGFLTGTGAVHLRRSLLGQKGSGGAFVGVAFAVWMAQLPSEGDSQVLVAFLDSNTWASVGILVQPDGTVTAHVTDTWSSITSNNWETEATEIGASAVGAFLPGTWMHVEVKLTIGASGAGSVAVKLNEESAFSSTSVDTRGRHSIGSGSYADNDSYVSQVSFLYNSGSSTNQLPIFLDDIVAWDSTGTVGEVVTDWVGDKNVVLQALAFDSGDGGDYASLADDWTPVGVGVGEGAKEAIDDFNDPDIWTTDPYDDTDLYPPPYYNGRDTETYLVATAVNDTSEFRTDVPDTITDIIGVVLVNSLRKTQASSTKVKASIIDGVTELAGTERPVAQDFTYYHDIIERDASNTAWTYATLNAAKVRIKRTV